MQFMVLSKFGTVIDYLLFMYSCLVKKITKSVTLGSKLTENPFFLILLLIVVKFLCYNFTFLKRNTHLYGKI